MQLTIPRKLHQSVLTVTIGIDKHPFVVHKERLCHYSSYFRTHFTWYAAGRKILEIPDHDREVFKIVEHWLYTLELRQADTEDVDPNLSDMIRVYVFAFKIGMPLLQDAVVDIIVEDGGIDVDLAESKDIQYLCDNTSPEAPLQRLLVAMFAFSAEPEWFKQHMDDLPKGFISQVALLNISRLPYKLPGEVIPYEMDICQYHEHKHTTETCPAKRNRLAKRKRDGVD